jgi:pimeloyl-ACP methyl ester carboxylesterase
VPRADLPTGISLDYATWGEPTDPTVLLVMGLSWQRIMWPQRVVEGLVDAGFSVVAFDNRDVGRSTHLDDHPVRLADLMRALAGQPVRAPYTLADMALDAVGLLDHLGIDRAHVVGVSMGGMIGQHVAFSHPQRVLSLTSIMSTTGDPSVGYASEAAAPLLVSAPPRGRAAYVEQAVGRFRILAAGVAFDEAAARELAGRVHDRGVDPRGAGRQLLAILLDGDRTDRLRTVAAPTLVIHGRRDPLVHVSGGEATARAVPGARLVLVDEMGHDLPAALLPGLLAEVVGHLRAADPVRR